MKTARFDLSDTEWTIIQLLLPNKPRGDQRVLNGIFYVLRMVPAGALRSYTSMYNRYNR